VSFTKKEGLKICQDLKLQKHLKWEMKRTRKELGSLCHQFDISTKKTLMQWKLLKTQNLFKPKTSLQTTNPWKPQTVSIQTRTNLLQKNLQEIYQKP
jgi:hypothetical protein